MERNVTRKSSVWQSIDHITHQHDRSRTCSTSGGGGSSSCSRQGCGAHMQARLTLLPPISLPLDFLLLKGSQETIPPLSGHATWRPLRVPSSSFKQCRKAAAGHTQPRRLGTGTASGVNMGSRVPGSGGQLARVGPRPDDTMERLFDRCVLTLFPGGERACNGRTVIPYKSALRGGGRERQPCCLSLLCLHLMPRLPGMIDPVQQRTNFHYMVF